MPLVPCTGIFLGLALISLILEQCRGVFERIYIFSPSIAVDAAGSPSRSIEQDLGVNAEKDQAYWEDWDEPALRIIQQQRKITETSKKLEMKKLYQVLIRWVSVSRNCFPVFWCSFPVSFSRRLRKDFQVGSEDKNDCLFVGQRIQWKQDSTFGRHIRRQILEAFCCLISCLLTFVQYYGSKLFLVACD